MDKVHGYITVEAIAGEPMICEQHFWKLWPHDGCAGPGMPLSGAEGYAKQLTDLQQSSAAAGAEVEKELADWKAHAKVLYDRTPAGIHDQNERDDASHPAPEEGRDGA